MTKNAQVLERFLRRFGSAVTAADHSGSGFGVLTPLKAKDAAAPDVVFGQYGFRMKRDYVLLLAAKERWIGPEMEVLMDGKRLHLTAVDDVYWKQEVLYRTAYGYEVKEEWA